MSFRRTRLLIAGVCGVLAALLVFWYVSDVRAEASGAREQALEAYGGERVEVYVADRNITAGEELSPSNVSKRVWLVDLLPTGALSSEAEVFGQTLDLPLLANEPVLASKLGSPIERVQVPEGYCALSVPSDDVQAVGGAIQPGSRVALYAAGAGEVRLLEAEVQVLATSKAAFSSGGTEATGAGSSALLSSATTQPNLKWVTLALQEERVQEVIAASQNQSLYLVLVGDGDSR